MEIIYGKRNLRQRQRSWSDDPNETFVSFQRVRVKLEEVLEFSGKSLATQTFFRPFNENSSFTFMIPPCLEMALLSSKSFIFPCDLKDFETEYNKLVGIADVIMGHQTEKKNKIEKTKKKAKEEKLKEVLNYFRSEIEDVHYISKVTKFSAQAIRRYLKNFKEGKNILEEARGRNKKLNEDQIEFIKNFFVSPENFDKTVFDLHEALTLTYQSDYHLSSHFILYDYLHDISITYKKIIYRNNLANTPRVKLLRSDVSLLILGAHQQSFDFIYIDECSFNLQTWALKGWSQSNTYPKASKPAKSKNYSAITAMDIDGILSLKIVKGGVKASDFFIFIQDLVKSDQRRFSSEKVVLFMDNASIHKSKDYMQKFSKYFYVMYNAPYTPQLNPIEFAFSKLKNSVRKSRPKTENELIRYILRGCKEITEKDAAEYVVHSLKFTKKAVNKEDFF